MEWKESLLQLVGVMGGGMIGVDPYAENSWSGSSKYFFRALGKEGLLRRAFGVDLHKATRLLLCLRYPSRDPVLWRQRHYLDTLYYSALARKIVRGLKPEEEDCAILQIGGIYDLRRYLGSGRRIISYHDGNLAVASRSPYFPAGLRGSRQLQRALAHEAHVARGIDLIMTMSGYLRQSFIDDYGVEPRRVIVVGAGINLDYLPAYDPDKRYDRRKILFIGADFRRKGGEVLLKAFRRVRDAHPESELIVIGPGNADVPAEPGVRVFGFVSRSTPEQQVAFARLLEEVSVFALPSLYEPFGIAPLEAMAHQIPAVLSDAWAFPEMVTPGVHGELVKVGDHVDLADKLSALLADPARLQAMGAEARKMVLEKYTWNSVAAKIRAILGDVDAG